MTDEKTFSHTPFAHTNVAEEWQARSWPVRAVGVLLVVQALLFFGISFYLLFQHNWQPLLNPFDNQEAVLTLPHLQALSLSVLLLPTGAVALISAIAIILMRPAGWLLAMIVQALILGGCLDLYFTRQPVDVYPFMLYSILLVLYLNSYDVRQVLQYNSAELVKSDSGE